MEIKFLQILTRTGRDHTDAIFQVDDKKIKIGITGTLRASWRINNDKEIELALRQIGKLKIMLMMIKNGAIKDYIFGTDDFREEGRILNFGEATEQLKNEILKAEEEKHRIGFKPN